MSTDVTEKGDNEHEIGKDIEGGYKRKREIYTNDVKERERQTNSERYSMMKSNAVIVK